MKLKKRYALTGVSFTLPFLAGFALLYLIPFLWSIQKTFTAGAGGIRFAGLQNYADLFRSAAFRLAAGNTFRFIAVGVPLLMALSFLLALALYRKFRGASFFRSAFLMPMVIPVAATITVVRAFFGDSGLTNQLLELLGLPIQDFMGSELAFPVGCTYGKTAAIMLGGRKTVICEFLGTGMISVMPVPLLSVHPRECSPQGHIRYVPSVCVYRWTCPVPPHKPPLQAL